MAKAWNIGPGGSHLWTVLDELPKPTDRRIARHVPDRAIGQGLSRALVDRPQMSYEALHSVPMKLRTVLRPASTLCSDSHS
jgi:hypothetical protein